MGCALHFCVRVPGRPPRALGGMPSSVTLSAAKGLMRRAPRSFAALRMTGLVGRRQPRRSPCSLWLHAPTGMLLLELSPSIRYTRAATERPDTISKKCCLVSDRGGEIERNDVTRLPGQG